jgi:hypothetical protein
VRRRPSPRARAKELSKAERSASFRSTKEASVSDEKSNPDDLTKTSKDDVTLTEAELSQVSGGWKQTTEDESPKEDISNKY